MNQDELTQLLTKFVAQFPVVATVLIGIGILRAVNKPLFALLKAYVTSTPVLWDDEMLTKLEQSKLYRTVSFALDWLGSVKLPKAPEKKLVDLPVEKAE